MIDKLKLIVIVVLLFGCAFLFFSWKSSIQRESAVEHKLSTAQQQIEEMKDYIDSKEKEVEKLNQELGELVYSKKLKTALTSAQGLISDLNSEIASLKQKNVTLNSGYITAESRLKLNSQQLARTIEELDESKKKINLLENQMQTRIRDTQTKAADQSQSRVHELEAINKQLSDLKLKYQAVEKEKINLESQLDAATRKINSSRQTSSSAADLAKLQRSLDSKNSEINNLQNQIERLKFSKQKEEELVALNKNLQTQVLEISSQMKEKEKVITKLKSDLQKLEKNSSIDDEGLLALREKLYTQNQEMKRISELYSNLKNKLKEIGDILTEREIEIAGKEKETAQLKGEIAYLRSRLNYWEEMSIKNKSHQEELLGELSRVLDINASLQEQLTEVSAFLNTNVTANDSVNTLLDTVGLDNQIQNKDFNESRKVKKILDKEKAQELRSKIQNILEKLNSDKQ
ncbi:MAG: hypothetical protein JW867_04375 [Candidatus Omnitrophica bacterium]|nr:hypothetical protein [Candidatus Omnitrophota bacterium]